DVPLCPGHSEECVLRTVRKEGPNQGKQFYACPRSDRNEQCNMFSWVDGDDGGGGGGGGRGGGDG
ncbi:unnamed protein product, partial [Hapterophycus canaliculatus]